MPDLPEGYVYPEFRQTVKKAASKVGATITGEMTKWMTCVTAKSGISRTFACSLKVSSTPMTVEHPTLKSAIRSGQPWEATGISILTSSY